MTNIQSLQGLAVALYTGSCKLKRKTFNNYKKYALKLIITIFIKFCCYMTLNLKDITEFSQIVERIKILNFCHNIDY